METTLRSFQRAFGRARAAADRGETVSIKAKGGSYLFLKEPPSPSAPFADLIHLFGVVRLDSTPTPREKIRKRLKSGTAR